MIELIILNGGNFFLLFVFNVIIKVYVVKGEMRNLKKEVNNRLRD